MGRNRPLASNIVIDVKRHKSTMAYVTCVADKDVIVLCNNPNWKDDSEAVSRAVSIISHETVHLVCLDIARKDDLSVDDRFRMWFGIDSAFKRFKGDTMNMGDYVNHGLFNVEKYLK